MSVFRFILLTLAAYRLTRVIVEDQWPPTDWLRNKVDERFGKTSSWSTLVHCPWCAGVYVTFAVFAIDHYLWSPPFWLLAFVAATALVGYLGTYDER